MHHRILIAALLLPLPMLGSPAPASAQIDFGGAFQRAMIIANQVTQISHQISQIRSMARQLTELRGQLNHMERAARGEIDALLRPFSDLAADPVGLVRDGLGWGSDFTGTGRDMVGAVRDFGTGDSFTGLWRTARGAADRVTEADILALYRDHPPELATRALEDYRRAREAADRQRVLDYAALDAAAALTGTIESAQGSFADLTGNGNLSREHLSRCAHGTIGSQASEMPPELPQSCSCFQQPPSARLVALPVLGASAEPVTEAGEGQPGSRVHPEHYGTDARMIPGFTTERRRTER